MGVAHPVSMCYMDYKTFIPYIPYISCFYIFRRVFRGCASLLEDLLSSIGLSMRQLHTTDTCYCSNQLAACHLYCANTLALLMLFWRVWLCLGWAEVQALIITAHHCCNLCFMYARGAMACHAVHVCRSQLQFIWYILNNGKEFGSYCVYRNKVRKLLCASQSWQCRLLSVSVRQCQS